MTFIEAIVQYLHLYPELFAFISGFLAEEILLFLAFLSGRDIISFYTVFFWGFIGALCVDSVYYIIAKSKTFKKNVAHRINLLKNKKILKKINSFAHHNILLTLFLSKFIYGPRMIIIMNFAFKKMPYKKLIYNDAIALLLWLILMLPLGWAAGQGIISSFHVVKEIEKIIAFAIIFIVLFYFLARYIVLKMIKYFKK